MSCLFNKGFDIETALKKCKYYDPKFEFTLRYSKEEAKKDYYLTLKYVESFEKQFCSEKSLVRMIKSCILSFFYGT